MNGKWSGLWLVAILTLFLAGCACHRDKTTCAGCQNSSMQSESAVAIDAERPDVVYVCNCGADCKCGAVSKAPGACSCGKELAWRHVVKVEGDEALLCTCDQGCTCQLDADDPTKCACGKPVQRVSLKGTGLYFCNCGGSCMCNTAASVPGDCRCGMPLKQVN